MHLFIVSLLFLCATCTPRSASRTIVQDINPPPSMVSASNNSVYFLSGNRVLALSMDGDFSLLFQPYSWSTHKQFVDTISSHRNASSPFHLPFSPSLHLLYTLSSSETPLFFVSSPHYLVTITSSAILSYNLRTNTLTDLAFLMALSENFGPNFGNFVYDVKICEQYLALHFLSINTSSIILINLETSSIKILHISDHQLFLLNFDNSENFGKFFCVCQWSEIFNTSVLVYSFDPSCSFLKSNFQILNIYPEIFHVFNNSFEILDVSSCGKITNFIVKSDLEMRLLTFHDRTIIFNQILTNDLSLRAVSNIGNFPAFFYTGRNSSNNLLLFYYPISNTYFNQLTSLDFENDDVIASKIDFLFNNLVFVDSTITITTFDFDCDGLINQFDLFPFDPVGQFDSDSDGIPDTVDLVFNTKYSDFQILYFFWFLFTLIFATSTFFISKFYQNYLNSECVYFSSNRNSVDTAFSQVFAPNSPKNSSNQTLTFKNVNKLKKILRKRATEERKNNVLKECRNRKIVVFFDFFMMILTVLSVVIAILPFYFGPSISIRTYVFFSWVDFFICSLFWCEIFVRFKFHNTANSKFLIKNWSYFPSLVPEIPGYFTYSHLRLLRLLRLLKILRLFRIFKLVRSMKKNKILKDWIFKQSFYFGFFLLFFVLFCSAVVIKIFENHMGSGINTLGDAIWFTIVSTTTTGFGDLVPRHPVSKLIAVFSMLFGLGTIATLIGNILRSALIKTKTFQESKEAKRRRSERTKLLQRGLNQLSRCSNPIVSSLLSVSANGAAYDNSVTVNSLMLFALDDDIDHKQRLFKTTLGDEELTEQLLSEADQYASSPYDLRRRLWFTLRLHQMTGDNFPPIDDFFNDLCHTMFESSHQLYIQKLVGVVQSLPKGISDQTLLSHFKKISVSDPLGNRILDVQKVFLKYFVSEVLDDFQALYDDIVHILYLQERMEVARWVVKHMKMGEHGLLGDLASSRPPRTESSANLPLPQQWQDLIRQRTDAQRQRKT
ncbi:hypothetical protein RCL1_006009 [Eukaryota sp. TZLM3-RCL]